MHSALCLFKHEGWNTAAANKLIMGKYMLVNWHIYSKSEWLYFIGYSRVNPAVTESVWTTVKSKKKPLLLFCFCRLSNTGGTLLALVILWCCISIQPLWVKWMWVSLLLGKDDSHPLTTNRTEWKILDCCSGKKMMFNHQDVFFILYMYIFVLF